MKYILKQWDEVENLIKSSKVDTSNIEEVMEAICYWDTRYPPHKREIKDWIESWDYKNELLSITGEDEEEDGFYTGTMYLELEAISGEKK